MKVENINSILEIAGTELTRGKKFCHTCGHWRGRFINTYELLSLRALKFSPVDTIYIFQCTGKIFCVEFQRYPLKFHAKYLTHTLKDIIFIQHLKFCSQI